MLSHASLGDLIMGLLASALIVIALFGLVQWLHAILRPQSSGDDETVGPRGFRVFIVAGIIATACIVSLVR